MKAAQAFELAHREASRQDANAERLQELQLKVATQYLRGGHLEPGTKMMAALLEEVQISLPQTSPARMAMLLMQRARLQLRGLKTSNKPDLSPQTELRLRACWDAATNFSALDPILAYGLAAMHLREALNAHHKGHIARGLAFESHVRAAQGGAANAKRVQSLVKRCVTLAQQHGTPTDQAVVWLSVGTTAYMELRWRDCVETCQRAIGIFERECHGASWEISTARNFINTALVHQGELLRVSRELPEQLEEVRARGDILYEAGLPTGTPNLIWLAQDRPDLAQQHAERSLSLWSVSETGMAHYLYLVASVQIALYRKDHTRALTLLEEQLSPLKRAGFMQLQSIRAELLFLLGRALLAKAIAQNEPSRRLEKTATRLMKQQASWAQPMAHTLLADQALLHKQAPQAREHYQEAAHGFAALHMHMYVAAAHHRLAELTHDEPHRTWSQNASRWMQQQEVVSPEAMVWMLMPAPVLNEAGPADPAQP